MLRSLPNFSNEPPLDFSKKGVRDLLSNQIALTLQTSFNAKPIINGEVLEGKLNYLRYNPNDGSFLGESSFANLEDVQLAKKILLNGERRWRQVESKVRERVLWNLSEIISERRYEFISSLILEAGKPWGDADMEVAEAIDFCRYYALYSEYLTHPIRTGVIPGEESFFTYRGRGLTAVIAPWNFPLAIACGMIVAPLVMGNCVIFKPAEQTSFTGFLLAKALLDAGVPNDVFAFLPGKGEEIGDVLVTDPQIATIVFTGSKSVGLEIFRRAYASSSGNLIKRVITELGGKNCIIIDADSDLDQAIKGVIRSSFGYAGQKCSAASRVVIIGGKLFQKILPRLIEATNDLLIGPATEPSSFIGPVIDKESKDRLEELTLSMKDYGELHCNNSLPNDLSGFFVSPKIFSKVAVESPLWQTEFFGPIIAVNSATNFSEAIHLANASSYALTGGVYSRNLDNIVYAKANFEVGNLYINRSITGALVGRHPFGGFKLSGSGLKAGGPDYLLQFADSQSIVENTARHGLY
jgi:RHH-type proline utilization regulon transcriptional repressor/proline dehydrogenase/delta 1-pyrroline-5-carboxylate dehydrogenase